MQVQPLPGGIFGTVFVAINFILFSLLISILILQLPLNQYIIFFMTIWQEILYITCIMLNRIRTVTIGTVIAIHPRNWLAINDLHVFFLMILIFDIHN